MENPNERIHAGGGTRADVQTPQPPVAMPGRTLTRRPIALAQGRNDWMERWGQRPRYVRNFVWSEERSTPLTSAMAMLYAPPCPGPPRNELSNSTTSTTIYENSHLFRIVSPINVDLFEHLLSAHPNKVFIQSVCNSLRQGFWPWAIMLNMSYPETYDNSCRPIKTEEHATFI
jgi:hypothetical protein